MGFLDNKGLKKVVNWVNEKINNIKIPEKGQPFWSFSDNALSISDSVNIPAYYNFNYVDYVLTDKAMSLFDYNHIPNPRREYKHRAMGRALKKYEWPSIFDMPWPNNEIPEWEDDHKYEIYIAEGRVVSVDDITPPVEEVIYTIEANESCTFELSGGAEWEYKLNNNNWIIVSGNINLVLPVGENVIYIRNLSNNLNYISYIEITNYNYLKVDCSKMKSDNLHKVLRAFKVDEIIYPEACMGSIENPVYKFEAPEIDLGCLRYNNLYAPQFNFKTDNFINIGFSYVQYRSNHFLFGENISNKNANKILRQLLLNRREFSIDNLRYLKTVGTKYDSIPLNTGMIYDFSSMKFINVLNSTFWYSNVKHGNNMQGINEIIFYSDLQNKATLELTYNITSGIVPKIFVENIDFDKSIFRCQYGRFAEIYTCSDIPEKYQTSKWGFIKVNSVEEVPFQYAPKDWDDVKNYDDEGNVIQ